MAMTKVSPMTGGDKDIPEAIPYDVVPETPTETEVQTVQPSTDTLPENVDEVEECDDDADDDNEADPDVSPYDLECKTHIEMSRSVTGCASLGCRPSLLLSSYKPEPS